MKTTKNLTAQEMIKGANAQASEKAVKSLKEKKPTFTGVQYNSKKIKVVFSKDMTNTLSNYYAVKTTLFEVARVYQNNIKVYQARINNESEKENPNADIINETMKLMLKSQACYKYFKAKINKELKPILTLVSDELYDAHITRFDNESNFKELLGEFFKAQGMELTDSLYTFIDKCIGVKSSSASKLNVGTIDNLGKGAFRKLIIDIICQVALDKSVLSKVIIEDTLNGTEIVDIKEFETITVVAQPTYKTTLEDYKKIFDTVGVDYKGLKKKAEFVELYKKSLKAGLFAEA